jgi:biotin carboxyl carrier protein
MLKAKTGQNKTFDIKLEADQLYIDNNNFNWDITETNDKSFHILQDNKSYRAELIKFEPETKLFHIKVNGQKHIIEIKDRFDLLLEKMGMSSMASTKINEIKAPMPGLILDIKIAEGDEVKKGDPIMILEAMKMENVLKSPGEGIVKAIKVKKGDSVEKNQVLIQF